MSVEHAPDIGLIFAPGPSVNHGLTLPPGHGLTIYHPVGTCCLGVGQIDQAMAFLPSGPRVEHVLQAGHFLHSERPREVNDLVLDWLS